MCSTCGVVPIVTCMIDGGGYAVVNVNTLEDFDRSRLVKEAASFAGETAEKRLARRRHWTPEAATPDRLPNPPPGVDLPHRARAIADAAYWSVFRGSGGVDVVGSVPRQRRS